MLRKWPDPASGGDGNGQRRLFVHATEASSDSLDGAMVKQYFLVNKHCLLQTSTAPREHQAMLDSLEIKSRFGSALKANPGLSLKAIAEACDVTPQAVGDWKRTGRIDKRHFQRLAEVTHTSLDYWLGERAAGETADHPSAVAVRDVPPTNQRISTQDLTELRLVLALTAQALAASTPIAGRELAEALRKHLDSSPDTFAGKLVKSLEAELSDLADTLPHKHTAHGSR